MVKVRAITHFISAATFQDVCERVDASAVFFRAAIAELREQGVSLQMVRIATNGFDQWADSTAAGALAQLRKLDARLELLEAGLGGGVAVVASIGQIDSRLNDGVLVAALAQTSRLFACVAMRMIDGLPDLVRANECAELVLALNAATRSTRGLVVNGPIAGAPFAFKLAITAGLGAGTPFFPGAYAPAHGATAERLSPAGSTWRAPAFAFACENSDLLVRAFARARQRADAQGGGSVLREAKAELQKEFLLLVGQLDALGGKLEAQTGVAFAGVDSSVASAACPEHSLVLAFESLGLGKFGGAGTTAVCALVTGVLKSLPFRLVGYCGLSARSPCAAAGQPSWPPSVAAAASRCGAADRPAHAGTASRWLPSLPAPAPQCCRRRRTRASAPSPRAAAFRSARCCSTLRSAARALTQSSCPPMRPHSSSARSTATWRAWPAACASRSPRASGPRRARARARRCG